MDGEVGRAFERVLGKPGHKVPPVKTKVVGAESDADAGVIA